MIATTFYDGLYRYAIIWRFMRCCRYIFTRTNVRMRNKRRFTIGSKQIIRTLIYPSITDDKNEVKKKHSKSISFGAQRQQKQRRGKKILSKKRSRAVFFGPVIHSTAAVHLSSSRSPIISEPRYIYYVRSFSFFSLSLSTWSSHKCRKSRVTTITHRYIYKYRYISRAVTHLMRNSFCFRLQ